MFKVRRHTIFIIAILVVAGFLRFFRLGQTPPSPDWDEAAIGYNAYSILRTGRDEYGTFLPLTIRSFDDYKPPLYVYATVPAIGLFGLNVPAVRLPSAVFGMLAVWGTYLLTAELFLVAGGNVRRPDIFGSGDATGIRIALLAAALLAISPWHIQFSRIGFEANLGVTLNIWGALLFLKGLKKNVWLIISAVIFGMAMYAYHSERVFAPFLITVFVLVFRRGLLTPEKRQAAVAAVFAGLLTVLPLIPVLFQGTTLSRFSGTSSFANQTELLSESVRKLEYDIRTNDRIGMVFDNRRIEWAKTLISGYLSHYSLKWLFLTGDNPRHHAPDTGLLHLWELPFILAGLIVIFRRGGKLRSILFGWLLISPVAAAPTTGVPHAVRTLVFLPIYQIIGAAGIFWAYSEVRRVYGQSFRLVLHAFTVLVCAAAAGGMVYFCVMYFGRMDREVSEYWQYGYRQAVEYAEANKSRYSKVVVSLSLEQPYIFFLFYMKYDPVAYLSDGGTRSGGFAEVKNAFDKYEFRKISWPAEKKDGTELYIGSPEDIPHRFGSMITYLDGTPAFEIADRE